MNKEEAEATAESKAPLPPVTLQDAIIMALVGAAIIAVAFLVGWPNWIRILVGITGGIVLLSGIASLPKFTDGDTERAEAVAAKRVAEKAAAQLLQREREETNQKSWAAEAILQMAIQKIINNHALTLQRKRLTLVRIDDYGNTFTDGWDREKEYFLAQVIAPGGSAAWPRERTEATLAAIEEAAQPTQSSATRDASSMDPYEYEHYCATLLREAGWEARVTAGSGDQGIDVVATKDGKMLVVQAKLYRTGSVGNAAVQEIFAGKQHMSADLAVVASIASFTRSAQELARTTGVLLLHHEELKTL